MRGMCRPGRASIGRISCVKLDLAALFLALTLSGCTGTRAAPASVPAGGNAVRATLGVETGAPSEELATELGLPFHVRRQGRVVESASGPAAAAGVRSGDVLLAIDRVELFSQDDIDDVVHTSRPGDTLSLRVRRPGDEEERTLAATLGRESGAAPPGIAWRYASLANLPPALEEARATKKNALVGLSGAET